MPYKRGAASLPEWAEQGEKSLFVLPSPSLLALLLLLSVLHPEAKP